MAKKILFIPLVILITLIIPIVVALVLPSNPTTYYNAYVSKMKRWQNLQQPRLMLVGFSELAFGIDSKMIEDSTGYQVCNFGLHAGLGADFVTRDMKKLAKKGDVVVYAFPLNMASDGIADAQSIIYMLDVCHEKIEILSLGNIKKSIFGLYPFLFAKIKYNYIKFSTGQQPVDTEYNSQNFNKYGDECSHWYKPDTKVKTEGVICGSVKDFNNQLYNQIRRIGHFAG